MRTATEIQVKALIEDLRAQSISMTETAFEMWEYRVYEAQNEDEEPQYIVMCPGDDEGPSFSLKEDGSFNFEESGMTPDSFDEVLRVFRFVSDDELRAFECDF